jgi:hypothetical protein
MVLWFNRYAGHLKSERKTANSRSLSSAREAMKPDYRGRYAAAVNCASPPPWQGSAAGKFRQELRAAKRPAVIPLNVSMPENLALLLQGLERVTCQSRHCHGIGRRRQIDRRPAFGARKGVAAMTSDSKMPAAVDPAAVLAERFQTLATKSQAAVQGFLVDRPDVANIGMGDPANIGQAFFELTTKLMADPRPVARAQIEFWEQSVSLWARTMRHLLGGEPPPVSAPDKRFKHPEWAENAIFSYIRDSYLLSARAILSAVRGVKGLDEETSRKVEFYTKQFVDQHQRPSNGP